MLLSLWLLLKPSRTQLLSRGDTMAPVSFQDSIPSHALGPQGFRSLDMFAKYPQVHLFKGIGDIVLTKPGRLLVVTSVNCVPGGRTKTMTKFKESSTDLILWHMLSCP